MTRVRMFLVAGVLAGVLTHAEDARAVWEWQALGYGCASQIATGPDIEGASAPSSGYGDHPWILGCTGGNPNPKEPARVYYLTWQRGGLIPTPIWNYDNFNAMSLYVNVNGWVFATDSNGQVWQDVSNNGNPSLPYDSVPSGTWAKVAPGAIGPFAVTVQTDVIQDAGEMWYPDPYNYNAYTGEYAGTVNIWGIGCGSHCTQGPPTSDASIYSIEATNYVGEPAVDTSWSPMIPGRAIKVTMSTDDGYQASGLDTLAKQTPWVLTAEGTVWAWNSYDGQNATYGQQGHWVQIPVPEPMVSISEGYGLGKSGSVWTWNGTASGGGTQTWDGWVAPYVNGRLVAFKQIAAGPRWPGAFTGGYGTLGGGEIWGIDYDGNIYFTVYVNWPPPKIQ